MILTKYDVKFEVLLTEQFVTMGFITLRFYCIGNFLSHNNIMSITIQELELFSSLIADSSINRGP